MSDFANAVRVALKNHRTAEGHEATDALVKRVLSELHGSGGPISPGKKAAQEIARQSSEPARDADESAGQPGRGVGVNEKNTPAADAAGTADKGSPAERSQDTRGKLGDEKAPDHHPSFVEDPDGQHTGRPVAKAPALGADKDTPTTIGRNKPGKGSNSGGYEKGADYADGKKRVDADALFAQASKSARNLIKGVRK